MFPKSGGLQYIIKRIEFQKQGLPHAHMLFKFRENLLHPDDIDCVVSAEMPTNPDDVSLIKKFMLHHHPTANRPKSTYCQSIVNGERVCCFHYPHPITDCTTINAQGQVHYHRCHEED